MRHGLERDVTVMDLKSIKSTRTY